MRSIATGETVDQGIDNASSDLVFAADSNALFYVRNDPTTLRSYQVWFHRLGTNPTSDVLIYEENDTTFSVSIGLSNSRKLALVSISEERTSEFRYLPIDQPTGELKVIEPRRRGVIYEVDHVGDEFFIRTNLDAPDFRLMSAPQATPTASHWREIVPEEPGHHLSHFEAFETFVAVDVEDETGTSIRVFTIPQLREIPVPRPAAIGVASSSFADDNEANLDPAATVLRFHFSNPLVPQCVYDFDVTTGVLTLRKQDPAGHWFDRHRYVLDQLSATASDGERVPITIVYRKGMRHSGGNPTLIVGYGAYGLSLRATFTRSAFSLIDRGFVYAIAHVRGGHEKGERWYAEGRMLNKRNTFTDFIAVTEALIATRLCRFASHFCAGRQRRRPTHGHDRQSASRPLCWHCRGSAVRGCRYHYVRRLGPAHDTRIRRMGQSSRKAGIRLHAVVFTLRQCRPKELSADVRYRRLLRQPGELCRTRQVGCKAAGKQDRYA